MHLEVEFDREHDGRWIAEIASLPGVMVYGDSKQEAYDRARALAFRVIADMIEHGEMVGQTDHVQFSLAA